jgi:phosphatidate cytidylyltransferase
LLPVGIVLVLFGGWGYALGVAVALGISSWEYIQLVRAGGYRPSGFLVIGGVLLLVVGRFVSNFIGADWMLATLVLSCMAYHLMDYERGRDHAGTDFGTSLGGILYLGWIGAYFISLRNTPDGLGQWWVLFILPVVWMADSGAYMVGVYFGRHKLAVRLSPKKTWEGYLGGIVCSTLFGAVLAVVYQWLLHMDGLTFWRGAASGAILGTLTLLGDLGESMFKRQVGAKDSGSALPGHGGFFDRIDSWLWGVVIGYYLVTWFFI